MATKIRDRTPTPAARGGASRRRPWWQWVLHALPAAAFLATFGFFFVDKNREARTVFKSGRGLLTVAAIVAGYLVIAFVLRRFVRWAWVAPAVLTLVVVALAAWIVRPYYVDETANRRLVEGPVRDASEVDQPAGDEPAADDSAPPPSPAAGPVRVSTGSLQGIDHDAGGGVSIITNPDRSQVVRFESFDIEGTPDPQVYLVPGEDQRNPGEEHLGRLGGTEGTAFDFPVPAGTDAGPGWTVLVWCGRFSVPIANATQAVA